MFKHRLKLKTTLVVHQSQKLLSNAHGENLSLGQQRRLQPNQVGLLSDAESIQNS
ncbi:MAG: hypothetical protein ACJATE_001304 [Bacteroidia bacterium]|jgi:hypothetical protein